MKNLLRAALAAFIAIAPIAPVLAANSTIASMTAASTLTGSELFYCVQGGADRKCTPAQVQTFLGLGTLATLSAAPAGTLTGTALPAGVVTSYLTAVGTIGTGVWQGSAIAATYIATGTSGAAIPLLNGVNAWSGAQTRTAQDNFSPIATVTPSGSTITWALASQQSAIVTLGTGTPYTMAAPSGIVSGGTYVLSINQGSTGTQLISTWNSVFKFPGGTKPTLSTAASSSDAISCFSPDGTNLNCVFQAAFQ